MRRVGKTTLLYQWRSAHLAGGVRRFQLPYLNFEDERLAGLDAGQLGFLVEEHARRVPDLQGKVVWCFDEIQVVPGWERFVRRLLDSARHEVMVTGSSAALLSREIATALRGRGWEVPLYPFSFSEVLQHRGLAIPEEPSFLVGAARARAPREAERIAQAEGIDLLATIDIGRGSRLAGTARLRKRIGRRDRIARGRRTTDIDAQHLAKMGGQVLTSVKRVTLETAIAVADVGDRVAQEVRNNLVFGFTGGKPAAPARYDLTLNVATSEARLGFEKDETAPAYQVTVTVRFELKEIASGRIILRSSSNGVASYDRSNQNFANIRARIDAENRAALQVSEHLQLRLAIALAKERPISIPGPVPPPQVVAGPSSQPRVPAPN